MGRPDLSSMSRKDLLEHHQRTKDMSNEWIRRLILEGRRTDVMAEAVLGYKVCPHHMRILRHQHKHRQNQILIWRGAGKTTIGTIAQCITQIAIDRNTKILIASKTADNARDFLKEIKHHLEYNEKLISIFGPFVGNAQWDSNSIEVAGRTIPAKEPTINTVGVAGAVASKHYDIIIADDLVDEENSRTKYQRDKMLDWFYKVLLPTLNPPNAKNPSCGMLSVIGTRYHYEDLYGHLLQRGADGTGGMMMGDKTLTIPIIDEKGNLAWPEQFSMETVEQLKSMGIIRFNSQYKCDCDAMKGAIFRYDDCQRLELSSYPKELRVYMGVDLAVEEGEEHDMFAIVVIGIDPIGKIYVLDYFESQLRFPAQTAKIIEWGKKWKPIRIGIEVNAYQKAQLHQVKADCPELNLLGITTLKDKVTRAWNLSPHFEGNRVFFQPSHDHLVEHMVLFPAHTYKDLFDAFDLAVTASQRRQRKNRQEPGVI